METLILCILRILGFDSGFWATPHYDSALLFQVNGKIETETCFFAESYVLVSYMTGKSIPLMQAGDLHSLVYLLASTATFMVKEHNFLHQQHWWITAAPLKLTPKLGGIIQCTMLLYKMKDRSYLMRIFVWFLKTVYVPVTWVGVISSMPFCLFFYCDKSWY